MKHQFYIGDSLKILKTLPTESVNCCVTSPPYFGLRDYGVDGQYGLEPTPEEYVANMVEVFREVKRVLRKDGTLWMNVGDSYAKCGVPGLGDPTVGVRNLGGNNMPARTVPDGLKPKDMIGIPWRLAFALQADGWWLRSDIIWSKPNAMPESVTDRPTKAHEYIFLLAKSERYYYDHEAIKEPMKCPEDSLPEDVERAMQRRKQTWPVGQNGITPGKPPQSRTRQSGNKERKLGAADRINNHLGSSIPWEGSTRNKRTVWEIPSHPYSEAHFATFPPRLIEPCILAGCPESGTVLDPFGGSGTVSMVAKELGRSSIYIDLNPDYLQMALKRCQVEQGDIWGCEYEVMTL